MHSRLDRVQADNLVKMLFSPEEMDFLHNGPRKYSSAPSLPSQ